MGTSYAAQAREILESEAGTNRGERHRDMARSAIADAALRAGGCQPVTSPEGMVRYLYDEGSVPTRRRAFAWLTLAGSGRRVPVNPRHVMRVLTEPGHAGADVTTVAFADGSVIAVRESDEDVVAELETVAA